MSQHAYEEIRNLEAQVHQLVEAKEQLLSLTKRLEGQAAQGRKDIEMLNTRIIERTAAYEAKDGRQVRKILWQETEIDKLRQALDWALEWVPYEGDQTKSSDERVVHEKKKQQALFLVQPMEGEDPWAEGQTLEMMLCETQRVILRPDKRYIFRVHPDCAECKRLAEIGNSDGSLPCAQSAV